MLQNLLLEAKRQRYACGRNSLTHEMTLQWVGKSNNTQVFTITTPPLFTMTNTFTAMTAITFSISHISCYFLYLDLCSD